MLVRGLGDLERSGKLFPCGSGVGLVWFSVVWCGYWLAVSMYGWLVVVWSCAVFPCTAQLVCLTTRFSALRPENVHMFAT